MALARWEKPVQDDNGNLVTDVWCRVRRELDGGMPLATLFSDREGAVPLSNPFFTASGIPAFHTTGSAYLVQVYNDGFEAFFHYQPVGLGAETDILGLTPRGLWSSATTYNIGDMVSMSISGAIWVYASLQDSNLNHSPDNTVPVADTAWWQSLGQASGATVSDVLTTLGITGITISTDEPSGGADGNLWLQI